jgi:hypothetical protein
VGTTAGARRRPEDSSVRCIRLFYVQKLEFPFFDGVEPRRSVNRSGQIEYTEDPIERDYII